ncbi:hypothetical protein [Nonomuraea dietziae]|uniref:hypothetical protein n=1 Tax=Nonomuraea dietziae TaxID=65515 RepID=UPI00343874B2
MDELKKVRELYGEPSLDPDVRARVAARLDAERAAPARRRGWRRSAPPAGRPRDDRAPGRAGTARTGRAARAARSWWAPIAAGAAIVVMATVAFVGPRLVTDEGEGVLLAAAGVVETRPATKGAYWHVKRVLNGLDVRHLWVARDGRAWTSQGAGRPVPFTGKGPFTMDGHELTIAQIEALPDEVGPLLEKVHAILGDVPDDEREGVVADAITGLLWSKPAPPDVRAAAYRALAGLSNVRYLGKGTFSYDVRGVRRELVIDRRSGQVLRATTGQATEAVLEAGWTDVKP